MLACFSGLGETVCEPRNPRAHHAAAPPVAFIGPRRTSPLFLSAAVRRVPLTPELNDEARPRAPFVSSHLASGSAAGAAADVQPIVPGELVRLLERMGCVARDQGRVLLELVERRLRRGDDGVDLRLVALRRTEGLEAVDRALDRRNERVGRELGRIGLRWLLVLL